MLQSNCKAAGIAFRGKKPLSIISYLNHDTLGISEYALHGNKSMVSLGQSRVCPTRSIEYTLSCRFRHTVYNLPSWLPPKKTVRCQDQMKTTVIDRLVFPVALNHSRHLHVIHKEREHSNSSAMARCRADRCFSC